MSRIVYFGSDLFSRAVLEKLFDSQMLEIPLIVTTSAKKAGRGLKVQRNPVEDYAKLVGIDCVSPNSLEDESFLEKLRTAQADIFLVVSYGKIVPDEIISLPRLKAINVHPSLLPKWRGASPIQSALLQGDRETGVSIIEMTRRVDAGDILLQEPVQISGDSNYFELEERLIEKSSAMVLIVIEQLENETARQMVQDESRASYSQKIEKSDGMIDWNETATHIHNQIRAFRQWPIAQTLFNKKQLRILTSSLLKAESSEGAPGEILELSQDGTATVQTGKGLLKIHEVQLEGKKVMDVTSFSRGYPFQVGIKLG